MSFKGSRNLIFVFPFLSQILKTNSTLKVSLFLCGFFTVTTLALLCDKFPDELLAEVVRNQRETVTPVCAQSAAKMFSLTSVTQI